ncbi:MAG TPA: peptidylprolyl isomerase, partial [bacterium]|nr:peptidylprolyl isomerase [bacterium]
VENFCGLAKKGFYNGLTFHRVIRGFVAQGGCPKGDGTGDPGYKIPSEFNSRKHVRGTVAMARSQDPDSAGCQFYICFGAIPHLDNQYTVFGQVVRGMEVVDKFAVTEPGRGSVGDKMKTIRIIE